MASFFRSGIQLFANALTRGSRREQLESSDQIRFSIGVEAAARHRGKCFSRLAEAEFKVFSQWGEDGIIQYLIQKIVIPNPIFVEFGVEDYRESNTRFLLQNNYWRGLILDGSNNHVQFLEESGLKWKYSIEAKQSFITRENIDELISSSGIQGDIGLLSIDLDGMDYWVFDQIRCVSPRILIAEYNGNFGSELKITVPYRADFQRTRAHFSNLYWGCSLGAIQELAESKGYSLVGTNRAGNNAFFIRNDVMGDFKKLSLKEAFVFPGYRESRSPRGDLTYVDAPKERLKLISEMPVVDILDGKEKKLKELLIW